MTAWLKFCRSRFFRAKKTIHHSSTAFRPSLKVAGEAGVEPKTPGLEGRRSIRLSHSLEKRRCCRLVASLFYRVPIRRDVANPRDELLFRIRDCGIGFSVQLNAHFFRNHFFHLVRNVLCNRSCRRTEFFSGGFDYLFFRGIENSFQIEVHDVSPKRNVLHTDSTDAADSSTREKVVNLGIRRFL